MYNTQQDALFKYIKLADYRSLPAQSSQQVMKSVFECWKSFYTSLREYKENSHKIDTLVIGQNKGWKQEMNIGKRNNQSFVSIPHFLLIKMITYKAEQVGIHVETMEESYTSRASFIDDDVIPTFSKEKRGTHSFSGTRVKRGLYKSKFGLLVNADVNGAANILKKAFLTHVEGETFPIKTVNVWDPVCV